MLELGRKRRVAIGAAAGIGAGMAMVPAAQAADFTVNNTNDDGAGSLREAITFANLTPATGDRILFQSGLSGRVELESDLPALNGPLVIEGPGAADLAIDGNESFGIFSTTSDTTVTGLTLANGDAAGGGAIGSDGGDLILEGVHLDGNSATSGGAVWINGTSLELRDSEVSGNTATEGAGILATGSVVTVTGSKISGNQALTGIAMGGGISITGDPSTRLTVDGSEISGNAAQRGGGIFTLGAQTEIDSSLIVGNSAMYSAGMGLGGLSFATQDSITNSTITENVATVAGGGITGVNNNLKLDSSTVTGNKVTSPPLPFAKGAGFAMGGGGSEISNSIVSGNTPADLSTLPSTTYPVAVPAGSIDGSFSLIGEKSDALFAESVAGSNIASTDPQLGPLAENGGPTRTMLPADTSPAVNKGMSPLTVDQRGLTRPIDFNSIPFSTAAGANGADIGAVELQGGPLPPPPDNAFSFGKVKLNKKKGVATLQVKVPGAGKVLLAGSKTVARSSKTSRGAATVNLTVKAKGRAAKQLKKKGSVKVKAKVSFTPTGGTAETKSKTVKLAKKKVKRRK
ncbi:MAG TPA: right-handed parallel beta-helix repeat-containing protein [Solirubrobacterales bacterium]|nr:right-handed parallel beta-helix repeat-containing protein [Solirubrobacterales bacterium]